MLLILSGPAGAGKTTVAQLLAEREPLSVHLRVDVVYDFLARGVVLPWLPKADEQNRAVARASAAAALAFSQGGYFVVVDGVVLPPMLALYREAAVAAGEPLYYAVLLPSEDDVIARGLPRPEKPAALTEAVSRDLYQQFARAEIAGRHLINSSALTPVATADEVQRRLAAGQVTL